MECQCNHYKAIMDLNGLGIIIITTQESILLDLIDSIEDKDKQRQIIENVLVASKKKLKTKVEAVANPAYTMTETLSIITKVLSRMKK